MSKVLIVDDEARIVMLLQSLIKSAGFEVVSANNGTDALKMIEDPANAIDILLTDLRMPSMDGMELFRRVKGKFPHMPVILLTAYASVETAIEAMKNGIFDYITKPFKVDELLSTMHRADQQIKIGVATALSGSVMDAHRYIFENVIAASDQMRAVCEMMQKVAPTAATVLINGESGTGKEVIARTIHAASPRKDAPWVAVNCAALPENLLESEMFGHVKGAFTGAYADKEGLFELANGGTLFLDEISSLPLPLQGKLLRVLQEHELRRVGGMKNIAVDVRIIAASNTNLEQQVIDGTFRADLYYRLAVITLDIPPLRNRKEDILPLVGHFISAECKDMAQKPSLSPEAAKVLTSYNWPGNVRELENAVKHALTFLQGASEIQTEHLPAKLVARAREIPAGEATHGTSLKGFLRAKEKEYMQQILDASDGDKNAAAKKLQVSLATLYRKLSDDE